MRHPRLLIATTLAALLLLGRPLLAQGTAPAADPSARLREVLPADVAERVLARIAAARARELPADALEQRALKFAARGVAPAAIERSVADQADRMEQARQALTTARGRTPAADEVEAGAEAMRQGVSGADVGALAKSAPSGRSLMVPLYVLGSLRERGLPSDEALARVQERLQARASDSELQQLPSQVAERGVGRPAVVGRELAETKRPASAGRGGSAGGPPAGVPANAGKGTRPTTRGRKP